MMTTATTTTTIDGDADAPRAVGTFDLVVRNPEPIDLLFQKENLVVIFVAAQPSATKATKTVLATKDTKGTMGKHL